MEELCNIVVLIEKGYWLELTTSASPIYFGLQLC